MDNRRHLWPIVAAAIATGLREEPGQRDVHQGQDVELLLNSLWEESGRDVAVAIAAFLEVTCGMLATASEQEGFDLAEFLHRFQLGLSVDPQV